MVVWWFPPVGGLPLSAMLAAGSVGHTKMSCFSTVLVADGFKVVWLTAELLPSHMSWIVLCRPFDRIQDTGLPLLDIQVQFAYCCDACCEVVGWCGLESVDAGRGDISTC